jgi:hypothetical protein
VAPIPSGGCQYDLRGNWLNDGRQTSGGYRAYSASVYVRQYRNWIYGQQDDGTGYYGQCIGNRLRFDVYQGYQFMGRQEGTVTGSPWIYPSPLYGDPAQPYAAPAPVAPPPPGGGAGMQASFTWNTWYGSGTETWRR